MKFEAGKVSFPDIAVLNGPSNVVDPNLYEGTPLERFNAYFETKMAYSADSIRLSKAIRYQVYCIQHPHETSDNPDGLEIDNFDPHSVHALLIHRPSGIATGTVRLVLPLPEDPEHSFAIQNFLTPDALRAENVPLQSTAEISRFCISQLFRRRVNDTAYGEPETLTTAEERRAQRRSGPLMRLGLMQAIVRMSSEHQLTHWVAVTEPTLLRMLDAMGVHFHRIGPLVPYHGWRQPCSGNIVEMLDGLKREQPDFWAIIKSNDFLAH